MALDNYLQKNDYLLLGGGLVLSLILSLLAPRFLQQPMNIEAYSRLMVSAIILWGVFSIHKAIQSWAGELARYLQLIGLGLVILMLSWVPHIGWHLRDNPAWMGMDPTFWVTLFHSLTVLAFIVSSYGFNLFWKKA